ncbi:MAG TPA: class I SAM-dependent methyltransferase [Candidatus Acidoferrales bacterium]|nr:class I SAM-dependent methyltransferase [Candidatus Acidoferrales bacterium]
MIVQALHGIFARFGEVPGRRLLDYGCGKGELSKIAREFGLLPVGIEQDSEARREIERQSLFPVYANLESLARRERDSRFDLIILWQVLEHLRRPWDELARLRGLLRGQGWLVAATPNAGGLKARLLGSRWDNYSNPTHFYYFTPRSLRAVFERAGFSPIEQWRFKLVYRGHGPLRRALHALLAATRLDGDLFFAGAGSGSVDSERAPAASEPRAQWQGKHSQ